MIDPVSGEVVRFIAGEAKWRAALTPSAMNDMMLGTWTGPARARVRSNDGVWNEMNRGRLSCSCAPIGTAARTCYAPGFWLGNRRGDIAALEWDDLVTEEIELFDGSLVLVEAFDFRQKKNRNRHGGREMFIPVVDKLGAALEPLDRSTSGTVLKNSYGKSFSEKSLTGMMQHWTRQAGIPDGYTRCMVCVAPSARISQNATSRRARL